MTIDELRNMYKSGTRFYIVPDDNKAFEITDLLFGTGAIYRLTVSTNNIYVSDDKVFIKVAMPPVVAEAWKKYSDDFYAQEDEE